MIIVVSDVHMAERLNDRQVEADDAMFLEFLDRIASDQLSSGGHLVLLGDIVDLWRRDFGRALMDSESMLSKLVEISRKATVHYVAGNHDLHMLRMCELAGSRFPFEVTKTLPLEDDGTKLFFIHGYQLEVLANPYCKSMTAYETFAEGLCLAGDDTGNAADKLWDTFKVAKSALDGIKRLPSDVKGAIDSMMQSPGIRMTGPHNVRTIVEQLASSMARVVYLGMKPDEFLIFGHTHRPFCDQKNHVANTGSWNKEPCDHYSFIEIDEGHITPKTFLP
ncbi:MAG: UDP-2,3-diacylglucosamine diphosphatase [Methanothrix sp.]|uniref:UDP-2,3-diacylglucosamine diphosphatase n=1 Tax=Methanothrix sp. TaxID=90426 RepID=UPI0032AF6933|nr:UDP-2,3-diacylglucosamine diphosphatase [Methanothrix sp.]